MKAARRIVYLLKKLWRGECADCRALLVEVKGWARADCPVCNRHYHTGL